MAQLICNHNFYQDGCEHCEQVMQKFDETQRSPMIDLTAIVQYIRSAIGATKQFGEYETNGEVEEWNWKKFYFCDHCALGQALYIDGVQVWNDW